MSRFLLSVIVSFVYMALVYLSEYKIEVATGLLTYLIILDRQGE